MACCKVRLALNWRLVKVVGAAIALGERHNTAKTVECILDPGLETSAKKRAAQRAMIENGEWGFQISIWYSKAMSLSCGWCVAVVVYSDVRIQPSMVRDRRLSDSVFANQLRDHQ